MYKLWVKCVFSSVINCSLVCPGGVGAWARVKSRHYNLFLLLRMWLRTTHTHTHRYIWRVNDRCARTTLCTCANDLYICMWSDICTRIFTNGAKFVSNLFYCSDFFSPLFARLIDWKRFSFVINSAAGGGMEMHIAHVNDWIFVFYYFFFQTV